MGAGKTTLIAALCRHLGVHEHVSSPTFAIINEYRGDSRIYHIDLFRVETLEEALALGIEDYLAGDDYCFIEWPQLIKSLLPPDTVEVHLSPVNEKERLLTLTIP